MTCSLGNYKGLLYTVLSGVCTIVWASSAKNMIEFNPVELTVYCTIICGALNLPFVVWNQRTLPKIKSRHIYFWILASVALVGSTVFRTSAFQYLPLGEASSITFSTPIFTAVFARFILKDRLTWMTLLSLLLSVVGILLTVRLPELIAHPQKEMGATEHLIGCGFALASVLCASFNLIIVRCLRDIPPLVNTFVQVVTNVIFCASLIPVYGEVHQPSCDAITSITLMGMGISAFLFLFFLNKAMRSEDPTTVGTVMRSTDIILAFLVQVTYYSDGVDVYSISGALLIFGCGLLMPLQRWMEGKPEGSPLRDSLWIK